MDHLFMDSLELFTGHLFYAEQPESRAEGSSCNPELRPYGQMFCCSLVLHAPLP